jgi:hypothetical protein
MFMCGIFAFSAVGLIRKVPLLKPALMTISLLCLLRAIIAVPVLVLPTGIDVWEVIASSVWLYVGICFLIGALEQSKQLKQAT